MKLIPIKPAGDLFNVAKVARAPAGGVMSNESNMRWLRFRVAMFYKEIHRKKRDGEYEEDLDWAYSVYDSSDNKIFPDVGIYVLYFDEFGPRGIGSPYSVYKIGLSDRMRKRWSTLQTGTPVELKPLHVIESSTLNWTEGWLHNTLRSRRISDDQEWFALSAQDIKVLLTIDVLNKHKTTHDEAKLLKLYEAFNPSDASQEYMFDL